MLNSHKSACVESELAVNVQNKLRTINYRNGNLLAVAYPDRIIEHPLRNSDHCGTDLSQQDIDHYESRQVFDIPRVKVQVTEHRVQIKTCPCCLGETKAPVPDTVSQLAQYGERIQATATYFSQYQMLPYISAALKGTNTHPTSQAGHQGQLFLRRVSRASALSVVHND